MSKQNEKTVVIHDTFTCLKVTLDHNGNPVTEDGHAMMFDRVVSEAQRGTIVTASERASRGIALAAAGASALAEASDTLYNMTSDSPTLPRPVDPKTGKHLARPAVWQALTGEDKPNPSAASRAFQSGKCRVSIGIDCPSIEAACTIARGVGKSESGGTPSVQVREHARAAYSEAAALGKSPRAASLQVMEAVSPDGGKAEADRQAAKKPQPKGLPSPADVADALADPGTHDAVIAAMVARLGQDTWKSFRTRANKAFNAAKS